MSCVETKIWRTQVQKGTSAESFIIVKIAEDLIFLSFWHSPNLDLAIKHSVNRRIPDSCHWRVQPNYENNYILLKNAACHVHIVAEPFMFEFHETVNITSTVLKRHNIFIRIICGIYPTSGSDL